MTKEQPTGSCPFGVKREGKGSGIVTVTKPDGRTRAIFFESGKATGADISEADPGDFSTEEQGDLPVDRPGETGYVVHCVEIAFWFASHSRSLEDALVYLAQAGGDTDTNAAVTGALLGARDGESAIPQRWMAQLAGASSIAQLGNRLLEAARK